jgi:hypothetical protein
MDNLDGQALAIKGGGKRTPQDVLRSDEMHAHREATAGEDRSAQLGFRRLIRTHGVEGDVNEHRQEKLDGFFYVENVAALISPAFGAGTVRQLPLVTAGALRGAGCGERVVRAALGGAGLGVTPLWVRHCRIPFVESAVLCPS